MRHTEKGLFLTKLFSKREILFTLVFAAVCAGCSKPPTPETDNNYNQSSYGFLLYKNHRNYLIDKLKDQDIQFVKYGDTNTLTIPADKYFLFESKEFNDMCYTGLNTVVKLLKHNPTSQINVAAFSDDTGSTKSQLQLTQGRAEQIITFLWANGIRATKLKAQGFGDTFPTGSNKQIHSSAYNRRIEIQWTDSVTSCCPEFGPQTSPASYQGMK